MELGVVRRSVGLGATALVAALLGFQGPALAQEDGCGTEVGCGDPGSSDPSGVVPAAPTEPMPTPVPTTVPVPLTGTSVPTTGATVPTTPTTGPTATSSSPAHVSPTTVNAGQSVTIRGGSFAPNQSLQMLLSTTPPTSLGSARSDATGSFSATATIPAATTAGTYRLTVSGPGAQGGTHESSASVTVALARTGVMTTVLTLVGAVALAAGAKLVIQSQWSRPVSTAGWAATARRRRRL